MPVLDRLYRFAAFFFILPAFAQAEAFTGLTYGSGPDGYRSYSFTGDVGLSKTVSLSLDYFVSKANGAEDARARGARLSWDATELISFNYRRSASNDENSKGEGNEGGLSLALDTLWQSELRTTLDIGYAEFKFDMRKLFPNLPNPTLTQNINRYGLSQDIGSSFTLYGSHDQYKYDRNVSQFPIPVRRRPLLINKALTLAAFPDKTNTVGITWKATDALNLDLSYDKTTTKRAQELRNTRLGADYQISDKVNIAVAVIRSTSSAMVTGPTVLQATRDTYSEVTAGWAF